MKSVNFYPAVTICPITDLLTLL